MRLDTGSAIKYNYVYDKWSSEEESSVTKFFVNKKLYKFDTAGRLLEQNKNGMATKSIVETGDIPLSDVQGFMAVKKILFNGDFGDWQHCRVLIAYNNSPVFSESRDIVQSVNTGYGGSGQTYGQGIYAPVIPIRHQFSVEPSNGKVYSIRIRLEILSKNVILSNIAFEVFLSNNLFAVPAGQRV